MKAGNVKNSITFFFLILFMSIKMVGLHTLSHTDDKDHAVHCAICDSVTVLNLTPVLAPDTPQFSITSIELAVHKEVKTAYRFMVSGSIASNQLFSRPPPVFL